MRSAHGVLRGWILSDTVRADSLRQRDRGSPHSGWHGQRLGLHFDLQWDQSCSVQTPEDPDIHLALPGGPA